MANEQVLRKRNIFHALPSATFHVNHFTLSQTAQIKGRHQILVCRYLSQSFGVIHAIFHWCMQEVI